MEHGAVGLHWPHGCTMHTIDIPAKQSPVINRLHDTLVLARAYADAIRDNAQDDDHPIPLELVASFQADCDGILCSLSEAAAQ
jgi:hypothetical protein